MISQSNLDNKIMELTTKQKGNLTELQCLAAFISLGCNVSIPYGDNCRYDFIVDFLGKLFKIQVKTATKKSDTVIKFSCRSTLVTCSGTKNRRYNENEIDYFATYWNNQCYLIPVNECSTEKTLRLEETKNNQKKGISFAKDYELEKQLQKIQGEF